MAKPLGKRGRAANPVETGLAGRPPKLQLTLQRRNAMTRGSMSSFVDEISFKGQAVFQRLAPPYWKRDDSSPKLESPHNNQTRRSANVCSGRAKRTRLLEHNVTPSQTRNERPERVNANGETGTRTRPMFVQRHKAVQAREILVRQKTAEVRTPEHHRLRCEQTLSRASWAWLPRLTTVRLATRLRSKSFGMAFNGSRVSRGREHALRSEKVR
jgi:hypothetical protein